MLVMMGLCSAANADQGFYDNTGDGLWQTAGNWWSNAYPDTLPGAGDNAILKNGKTANIDNYAAVAYSVYVGSGVSSTLNLLSGGGTLTAAGTLFVGTYTGGNGTMTVDGDMNIAGGLNLGFNSGVGTLTVNSGTSTFGGRLRIGNTGTSPNGTLTINNGATVKSGDPTIAWTDSTTSTIALDLGGTLVFTGDASAAVNWGLGHGMIVATGSAIGIDWDYDLTTPGETTVWAIPEPAIPAIRSSAWELITQDDAPYTSEEANWRIGNYMQSLFCNQFNLPVLSENFFKADTAAYGCPADTGLDLLSFSEEAMFTPIVRLELIKKCFQGIYASCYPDADAVIPTFIFKEGQISYLRPSAAVNAIYPASRLMALDYPDTRVENVATIYPKAKVSGIWHDDSDYSYSDPLDNVYNSSEDSYETTRNYTSVTLPDITIEGKGWGGYADKLQEIIISSSINADREHLQLVIDNFTDDDMAFDPRYAEYDMPETIQLPDRSEVAGGQFSISSPSYDYLIIYPKDADNSGAGYQGALVVIWENTPSSVTVDWDGSKYHRVSIDYAGGGSVTEKVWIARITVVDPSLSLNHLHKIATNVLTTGNVGMPGYVPYSGPILEEHAAGLPAGAYILCKYDTEEDPFGGDYADTARQIATQAIDDKIAMCQRGRATSSSYYEYITGAYFLSLLYDLPGFYDAARRDYYYNWMCTWADNMISSGSTGKRAMLALWRAYLLSGDVSYKNRYDNALSQYSCSVTTGLTISGVWQSPRSFYNYGEAMALLGQRATSQDLVDLESLVTYLANQNRWTDCGYMGVWWEVTIENHNFFGRWAKGLGMESAPKSIINVSEFPVYYKDAGGNVVVEITHTPTLYNPDYLNMDVMDNYLPLLPHKIAKSILFRIENILLKSDYHNNWWVGTENASAISDLNLIRTKTQAVLDYIDNAVGDLDSAMNLLLECDFLYTLVKNSVENGGLWAEVLYCERNHIQLKNVMYAEFSEPALMVWDGGGADDLWSTANNWDGDSVPRIVDDVIVSVPGETVLIEGAAVSSTLKVANESGPSGLGVTAGGTLSVANQLTLGHGNGAIDDGGTMTLNGGDVSVGSNLLVGNLGTGALNMNSGRISVAGWLVINQSDYGGSTGHVQLDGGMIETVTFSLHAGGSMDITGGALVYGPGGFSAVDGLTIEGAISNGYITADGGAGVVSVDTNSVPGRTILTAADNPTIIGWSISNNVMRMVVDAPGSVDRFHPEATTNLMSGVWGGVAHSDDGVNPFVVTNLTYSTAEGTNEVIYVNATNNAAEFFKISSE